MLVLVDSAEQQLFGRREQAGEVAYDLTAGPCKAEAEPVAVVVGSDKLVVAARLSVKTILIRTWTLTWPLTRQH